MKRLPCPDKGLRRCQRKFTVVLDKNAWVTTWASVAAWFLQLPNFSCHFPRFVRMSVRSLLDSSPGLLCIHYFLCHSILQSANANHQMTIILMDVFLLFVIREKLILNFSFTPMTYTMSSTPMKIILRAYYPLGFGIPIL